MPLKAMYLYGKNSILERLKANPKSIKRMYAADNFNAAHITNAAKSAGIPLKKVSERELEKIKRADRLQGIVAEVEPFKYTDFDELISEPGAQGLSLICLDNIYDPHNLGSIIRTAACFGGFAVIIPRHGACEVNDTVMHVASGGENFVPVSIVNNTSTAVIKAKNAGFWIVGAVVEEGEDINKVDLPYPVCLVLGSEGKGIRHGVKKHLDMKVKLPMKGAALSFNVAVASAMFSYEIVRQKSMNKKGGK